MKRKRINIIPPELRIEQRLEATVWVRRISLSVIVLLLALSGFNIIQAKIYQIALDRERKLQYQLVMERERLTPMIQRLNWLETQMRDLNDCARQASLLEAREYFRWSAVLHRIGRLAPDGLWLTDLAFERKRSADPASGQYQSVILITGGAWDYHTVAGFVTALEESRHFTGIRFLQAAYDPGTGLVKFTIDGQVSMQGSEQ